MTNAQKRRYLLEHGGNPFERGPCFTGPRDHRFCRGILSKWPVQLEGDRVDSDGGPIHYVDRTFKCPCPCGHPEPPADALPGKDMHRVKPCPTSLHHDELNGSTPEAAPS